MGNFCRFEVTRLNSPEINAEPFVKRNRPPAAALHVIGENHCANVARRKTERKYEMTDADYKAFACRIDCLKKSTGGFAKTGVGDKPPPAYVRPATVM